MTNGSTRIGWVLAPAAEYEGEITEEIAAFNERLEALHVERDDDNKLAPQRADGRYQIEIAVPWMIVDWFGDEADCGEMFARSARLPHGWEFRADTSEED
jgi:hypothetical protein